MHFVSYNRTFVIQASHFGSIQAYEQAWTLLDLAQHNIMVATNIPSVIAAMTDIHGHNFKIDVVVGDVLGDHESWLISDVDLEAIVMEWNNVNLSLHRDFAATRMRATTERMASILVSKLTDRFGKRIVSVTVHETNCISAKAYSRAEN